MVDAWRTVFGTSVPYTACAAIKRNVNRCAFSWYDKITTKQIRTDGKHRYVKLNENVDLEDTLHFPVNHTNNYVDPLTGAHTQTIEGLWNHAPDFLPSYGMKPKDLDSYLSAFMWFRYVKQRKLDVMKHFLLSAAHCFPPTLSVLPVANQQPILRQPRPPIDNDDEDFVEV